MKQIKGIFEKLLSFSKYCLTWRSISKLLKFTHAQCDCGVIREIFVRDSLREYLLEATRDSFSLIMRVKSNCDLIIWS